MKRTTTDKILKSVHIPNNTRYIEKEYPSMIYFYLPLNVLWLYCCMNSKTIFWMSLDYGK